LIGLALPDIVANLGDYSIADGIKYGIIISLITILLRYLWVYPAAYIPRWISAGARKDPSPGWKGPLVISWAGMRGVVSLATALSIPLLMTDGTAFPQRNIIIFVTFIVIFITLVFQGLTLPLIVRWIKLKEIDNIQAAEQQQAGIQLRLNKIAAEALHKFLPEGITENELLQVYQQRIIHNISSINRQITSFNDEAGNPKDIHECHIVLLEVYAAQRKELFKLRKEKHFSDEEIRKSELQLDLNELLITGAGH